ncbi:MAG: ABC transporter permease subunit [Hyphomicrobiales bacterium]|nr:ABC transporter permease subunit [Hyphomicrobiales bacterium]
MIARLGPPLAVLLLAGPVLCGLVGTVLPAFGYLPALGGTRFTLAPMRDLLAEPGLIRSALTSLAVALVTAAAVLMVVVLFVAGWSGTRIFGRILHLVSPLLSVPHAAAAFGLAFLIAPSGMIARLLSPWLTGWQRPPDLLIVNDPLALSMTAGLIVKEIPFLLLITLAALPQVKLAETRALAASLGYGRIAGFLFGVWPRLYRQIRLAVFAVIAFSSSVVDVAQILGPTLPPPLAVRIVGWANDPDLARHFLAAAGALLQLGVTALALIVWLFFEGLAGVVTRRLGQSGRRWRGDAVLRRSGLAAMVATAAAVGAGLALLSIWSVAGLWQFPETLPHSFTASAWIRTIPQIARPLGITLACGLLSTLLAIAVTLLCLTRELQTGRPAGRWALTLLYLPLIVPEAAFLFGLQIFFLAARAEPGLPNLVLAHFVFVMPYVFLALSGPWRAFDRRHEAIAAGLGKSRRTILFSIRLPMLLGPILTAAAVGFAVSVGQYLATVMIGAGRLPTITTEAVALAAGGNRRVIGVYALLQMLLPAVGFAVAIIVPALLFRRRRAMRAG